MVYSERRPSRILSPFVECFWTVSRPEAAGESILRVIPDGCIDLLLSPAGELQISGPRTAHYALQLAPGSQIYGVRLKAGAVRPILGAPVQLFRDCTADLDDLWHLDGRLRDRTLDPWTQLEQLLLMRLNVVRARPDPMVLEAVERLRSDPMEGRVGKLAEEIGLSVRQLLRRFDREIGLGPKRLARILRLQRLLDNARRLQSGRLDWAALALEAGYSDQAHMIHETQSLAGVSAARLLLLPSAVRACPIHTRQSAPSEL